MQYVVNHPCRIPRHVQDLCLPTALAYIISMDLFTQSEIADHGAEGFKGFRPGRTAWSCTDICGAEGGWEYDVTSSVSRVRRERRRLSSWTERPSWLSGRACMLHPSVKRLAWRRGGKSRLLWPGAMKSQSQVCGRLCYQCSITHQHGWSVPRVFLPPRT